MEILTTRDQTASNTKAVTATLLPNTGYTVGSNSEGTVSVKDPDQVNVRFADGCGQTITVGEGAGEASFDMVFDNPVAYTVSAVITFINGAASAGNDYSRPNSVVFFDHLKTRATVTVPIIDDTQLEHAHSFKVQITKTGLGSNILTPTCGQSSPHLTIEITDNDTANIVLDAPEEVTEGDPIRLGFGPRPNVNCQVPFDFETTLTITGDTAQLQDSPATSETLRLQACDDPEDIKIKNDDSTNSDPVWQTIDQPGQQGDRRVTFTIGTLMSSEGPAEQLIPERMSATVTIKDNPENINVDLTASIEAIKSPVVEGEEEVEFRITLSRAAPAGGINVNVKLAPYEIYTTVNPVSVADYRTHNVHIAQGQTEAILEIRTTRDKIANDHTRLTATLLTGTDYVVSDTPSADVVIRDPDQVNIRFADGCGQTRTVAEGDGEVSFDIVLDNPTAFDFTLVITYRNGLAGRDNDFLEGPSFLQFEKLQTSFTVTVPIIDDIQLEHTEGFFIQILGNGLDPDLLTPTCGESNPRLSFEITDNDTANIVLDAPEEVTEGQPIKLGLGPRPNVLCPVQFPFTTTLTITGDTDALQDSPGSSVSLELSPCASPQNVHIENDDSTNSEPVWQTIDDPGTRGDRQVTFTVGPLMSSDSRVSKLILERTSATVTIQNKPNRQPTGRPTLSGTDQVGHTLTASTSGIDDPDGLTSPDYTYQWQRQEGGVYTDITGTTAMVYTLSPEDQGKRVRVQVTLTDDDRNIHTLESVPTGLVQAQTNVPAGQGQGVSGRNGIRG